MNRPRWKLRPVNPPHPIHGPKDWTKPEVIEERMADDKQNHAQSIDNVMGAFQAMIDGWAKRGADIHAASQRVDGKVNGIFDHAEYALTTIEGKADSLAKFLGPPPNEINMPKQIEGTATEVKE